MKANLFRFLVVVVALSLLLSSCSSAFATPTNTSTPTLTFTPTRTSTPTMTPSPTLTPTPTLEGATGFDKASGRYIKVENSKTYYWFPLQINANDTAEGHWFESRMVDGKSIPLIDQYANSNSGYPDMIPMQLYFIDNLQQLKNAGYLQHPDGKNFYTSNERKTCAFTNTLIWDLMRVTHDNCNWKTCKFEYSDWTKLLDGIKSKQISFNFKVLQDTRVKGDAAKYTDYTWKIGKGYDVFVINWDDADPAKDPTFAETETGLYRIRWKMFAVDEKLVFVAASPEKDQIKKDVEFLDIVFAGPALAVSSEYVPASKQAFFWTRSIITMMGLSQHALGNYSCTLWSTTEVVKKLPHVVVIPEGAPTPTPWPTFTATVPPTCGSISVDESIPENLEVINSVQFDNPSKTDWFADPSVMKIKDGCMTLSAKNWTGRGTYNIALSEGRGVLLNFKYTQGSIFEMIIDRGNWDTSSYKSFGVILNNGKINTNIWQGKSQVLQKTLSGNLNLSPDTWYSILLLIDKDNKFSVKIWNPSNFTQKIEYSNTFGDDWGNLTWTFGIGGEIGTSMFDNFKEVKPISQTPTPLPTVALVRENIFWDFNKKDNFEGWEVWNQLDSFQTSNGTLITKSTGDDPYMGSPMIMADASALSHIEIRMKISNGDTAEIYFITNSDVKYDEAKMLRFPVIAGGQFSTYVLDMSKVKKWNGVITQIRLDPTITQADIEIDYIHILP